MATKKDLIGEAGFPQALHDMYKSNGGDWRTFNDLPSLARQEFAAECDINTIMARYERTGAWPMPVGEPFYADFTQIPDDLMGTLRAFDEAERAFMMLPASVRKEFENNPHNFVEFAQDPNNLDQMREWGLAPKAPGAAPGTAGNPLVVAAPPAPEPAPEPAKAR